MKIDTVLFNHNVPDPSKGHTLHRGYKGGFQASEDLKITLEEGIFTLDAPKKGNRVFVPVSNVIWYSESSSGQETGTEDTSRSRKKVGKKNKTRSRKTPVRTPTEVRSGPKQE